MPRKKIIEPVTTDYKLTHPEKILYPEDGITKLQLATYYESVAEWILPYIVNRPLTLLRCPVNYNECFFQKHGNEMMSENIHNIAIKDKADKGEYLYITDKAGLMSLPQLGVLEIHPWSSTIKHLEEPDMIIFDFDPDVDLPWERVVKAAFEAKTYLEKLNLKSFVRTTGGKGLHVVVPVKPKYDWVTIREFAQAFVNYLVEQHPKDYIGVMTKSKRKGKIFIDYLRNARGATAIASYSTRARLHAPVAVPLKWSELTNKRADTAFTITTVLPRLKKMTKDPWEDFFKLHQTLKMLS